MTWPRPWPRSVPDTGGRSLVLRRELAELARLRDWADVFSQNLRLPGELVFRLQLCLEEAVANIILHGSAAPEHPEIGVTLSESDGAVTAAIEDQGQPFDPREVEARPPPASLDEAAEGGFGILLMRRFASDIAYERVGARNRLVLRLEPRPGEA